MIDFKASEQSYVRNRKEFMGMWKQFRILCNSYETLPHLPRKLRKILEDRWGKQDFKKPRVILSRWVTSNPEYRDTIFIVTDYFSPDTQAAYYPFKDMDVLVFYDIEDIHYSLFVHELQHRKRYFSDPDLMHDVDLDHDVEIEAYYTQFCAIVDANPNTPEHKFFSSHRWAYRNAYLNDHHNYSPETKKKFLRLCRGYLRRKRNK